MSENDQHNGPKQTLNQEAMLEKLGNVKTARKSLKVRKTECSSVSVRKSILR